jgi:yeast amino acid transporter
LSNSGSFAIYSTRFIDAGWGFAMGWNYALGWVGTFPFELLAAGLTVRFWNSHISEAVFITIFWVAIVIINVVGVRAYGEVEVVLSMFKVMAVIGFIILGIVIDLGGSPSGIVYGTKYWQDPGSFNNGFKGICAVFVTAAFAFSGTELVGLAAAETVFNSRLSLTIGKSPKDYASGRKASYMANYYILYRLAYHRWMYRSIYGSPAIELFI